VNIDQLRIGLSADRQEFRERRALNFVIALALQRGVLASIDPAKDSPAQVDEKLHKLFRRLWDQVDRPLAELFTLTPCGVVAILEGSRRHRCRPCLPPSHSSCNPRPDIGLDLSLSAYRSD
jgi:hypothetical protein